MKRGGRPAVPSAPSPLHVASADQAPAEAQGPPINVWALPGACRLADATALLRGLKPHPCKLSDFSEPSQSGLLLGPLRGKHTTFPPRGCCWQTTQCRPENLSAAHIPTTPPTLLFNCTAAALLGLHPRSLDHSTGPGHLSPPRPVPPGLPAPGLFSTPRSEILLQHRLAFPPRA